MLGENLRFLRKQAKLSQDELSQQLQIPRTTLGDYERGKTEPNLAMLSKLAEQFNVTVDDLIKVPLKYRDLDAPSDSTKILTVTTDMSGRQNIELVSTRAAAGYVESFQDPEFISDLPKMNIPQLSGGHYRAFEIEGESMLPVLSGSVVICNYVERIHDIKDRATYIIASKNDGVVYKRVVKDDANQALTMISDNNTYAPYTLPYSEVGEIWKYQAHIGFSDAEEDRTMNIESRLLDIQNQLMQLTRK